jgi:predicted HTH transcriptional regulator
MDGRFYMRFGAEKREVTRAELSMWLDELRPLGFENIPLATVTEDDFDDALLWSFAAAFDENGSSRGEYNTAQFLKKDLLLAVGTGDEFLPTVAGLLLFGRSDRVAEFVPRSAVTLARFSGSNGNAQLIEKAQITGNLLSQYDAIIKFLRRYVDLWTERPRRSDTVDHPTAKPRANYNADAVAEAVANALIHRDLALREIPTRILIYDDSIEFINPRRTGGFVPPASRAIRYGVTQRLNPQIAAIFAREEYGTSVPAGGLPMILRRSHAFSGRRAEVYTSNDEFKLRIFGA